jgi:DNA-binding NtrC family response regulator
MSSLLLLSGPSAGLRFEIVAEATLGRSPSCEIPLEDSKVSRRHAKVAVAEGQARITDLGSRNGTVVNGERIEGEAVLLPGDHIQVGDSTILFAPPAKASLIEKASDEIQTFPVEEVIPAVGAEAALYSSGISFLSATSETMILRRAAEELARAINAEKAAALMGGTEGLITASVIGAEKVEVPRALVRAALEHKETGRAGGVLCAPLAASGGLPFGILYAERPEPFTVEEQKIAAAMGRLAGEAFAAARSRTERDIPELNLLGSSRPFRKMLEQARRAAATTDQVVLHGELGTGKALVARYIHSRSTRGLGPLVTVDCRRAPNVVDEDLFGRPSGPGVPPLASALLRADQGTLLLQQVEGLPRAAAARLARFLLRKVAPALRGGEEPVDVRVIATSAAALPLLAAKGELEPELAKALAGMEIELIPLRDRKADVAGLFDLFAGRVARAWNKAPPFISPEARRLLAEYAWPGNVSELKQIAERLATLYSGTEVSALRLPPEVQEGEPLGKAKTLDEMVARLERDAIAEALREARGKKIRAAAILGISRPTLDKKIDDYQLSVEKVRKT